MLARLCESSNSGSENKVKSTALLRTSYLMTSNFANFLSEKVEEFKLEHAMK